MITLATRSDILVCRDLIVEFLQETSYANHNDAIDHEHILRLVYACLHQGFIWLLWRDGQCQGLLVAVKEQNIWMPSKTSLREMVWYVRPQYRSSTGAGRLFVKFCDQAEQMLAQDQIQGYFTTRMTTTTDYDLERRGFRLTEKLYIKD